jgi:hypothetical protein
MAVSPHEHEANAVPGYAIAAHLAHETLGGANRNSIQTVLDPLAPERSSLVQRTSAEAQGIYEKVEERACFGVDHSARGEYGPKLNGGQTPVVQH